MKKIFLLLSLALTFQIAGAQQDVKSVSAAKSAVENAQKAADDVKKNTKAPTWVKLGQTLLDAYIAPAGNGWTGASKQELDLVLNGEKPVATADVEISGQPYQKVSYATRDYYFNPNGVLSLIIVTSPIYPDCLERALAAYQEAAKLDPKGQKTKDIVEGIKKIDGYYNQEAYDAYMLGDIATASKKFELAAEAMATAPCSQIDTNAVYNTAYTAWMNKDYERAKTFYKKSIENGYTGESGDAYAKLGDIADKQGDKKEELAILEEGFTKYPQSQAILVGLINYYLTSGENANRLFSLLEQAKKNDPKNASLYYVEGNIHSQLGQEAEAFAAWDKSSEVDPNYEFGYIGKGIYLYNKAVDIQTKAQSENDDAKYDALMKDFDAALKGCIEPFEKAFDITKDNAVKASVAEYLKNACFRFRTESEDYVKKYEKYSTFSAQ